MRNFSTYSRPRYLVELAFCTRKKTGVRDGEGHRIESGTWVGQRPSSDRDASHLRCDRCEPSANALAIISPSPWPSSSSCLMLTACRDARKRTVLRKSLRTLGPIGFIKLHRHGDIEGRWLYERHVNGIPFDNTFKNTLIYSA